MNGVFDEVQSISAAVATISAEQVANRANGSPRDGIPEVHTRIRRARMTLNLAVMQPGTGFGVARHSAMQRLGGLHEELIDEFASQRVVGELVQELGGLLHDVEFVMARRAEDRLTEIVSGSEDAKRARFVQGVVVLILAGAALFTGIMTIPGSIFPGTYPTAGLWALVIVLASMGAGYVLYKEYRRPPRDAKWLNLSAVWIILGALAVALCGLVGIVGATPSFVTSGGLAFLAALMLAWQHSDS